MMFRVSGPDLRVRMGLWIEMGVLFWDGGRFAIGRGAADASP